MCILNITSALGAAFLYPASSFNITCSLAPPTDNLHLCKVTSGHTLNPSWNQVARPGQLTNLGLVIFESWKTIVSWSCVLYNIELIHVPTKVSVWGSIKLDHLTHGEERKKIFAPPRFTTRRHLPGIFLARKSDHDEGYVVLKLSKLTWAKLLRFLCVWACLGHPNLWSLLTQ